MYTASQRRHPQMTPEKMTTDVALRTWQQVITRVDNLCSQRNEDQLAAEVAPRRNRLIYIWRHLTAIHDAMFPILRVGERLHAELDLPFVSQPDKSVKLPLAVEIGRASCRERV